jgi:hypothetical protein
VGGGQDIAQLTNGDAVWLAQRYVAAYNDRDLDAVLNLQHQDVVSYPVPMFGQRRITGRESLRRWWEGMAASGVWYEVIVGDIRHIGPGRVAILGEIRARGERLTPWSMLMRVRDGLVIESHSYLSDASLLEDLGLLDHG